MKICILTPRFPFPENGGDVLRINNIARYLKAQGNELVLVSFCEGYVDEMKASVLYDKIYVVRRRNIVSMLYSLLFLMRGKPIQCGYYYSREFYRVFKDVVEREHPDRYLAHLTRMVPYLVKMGVQGISTVEMTDALSKTYALSSKAKGLSLKKIIYGIEKRLIMKYERMVIKTFPKVVLVSESDIDYLRHTVCDSAESLCFHTNGVNCVCRSVTYDADKICFIGNMRTLQNQDAVLNFIENIFPKILDRRPNAMFYIVGAEPSESIRKLERENKHVVVTGFVDDLEGFIRDSCLVVAPVRIAAGIQNKVLVAMGVGLPVVMTTLISRAIPELMDSVNCMISEDYSDFAQRCLILMDNSSLRESIAVKGYDMVKTYYSWNSRLNGY